MIDNIQDQLNKALCIAARNGHLSIVKSAIENGADVDNRKGFPLRHAAKNGHLEIVQFLIAHKRRLKCNEK